MTDVEPPHALPASPEHSLEQDLPLGPCGSFRVAELKRDTMVSGEGEPAVRRRARRRALLRRSPRTERRLHGHRLQHGRGLDEAPADRALARSTRAHRGRDGLERAGVLAGRDADEHLLDRAATSADPRPPGVATSTDRPPGRPSGAREGASRRHAGPPSRARRARLPRASSRAPRHARSAAHRVACGRLPASRRAPAAPCRRRRRTLRDGSPRSSAESSAPSSPLGQRRSSWQSSSRRSSSGSTPIMRSGPVGPPLHLQRRAGPPPSPSANLFGRRRARGSPGCPNHMVRGHLAWFALGGNAPTDLDPSFFRQQTARGDDDCVGCA